MIKVSVIAPVYNVAGYLEKSVTSFLNQSLKEIELVLVDDGATDGSAEILDELASRDDRIVVIHKTNGGAADARNKGIEIAKGEYFYFLDPDDWAEPDFLTSLVEVADKNQSDLVIAGFTMEYYENGKNFSLVVSRPSKDYPNFEVFKKESFDYFNSTMLAVPWNKLYRAELIKNRQLRFPNVKWDDLHFNLEVVRQAIRVTVSDNVSYHFFRSRPGSETTTVFSDKLFDARKAQFQHILGIAEEWNYVDTPWMAKMNGYFLSRVIEVIQIVTNSALSKAEQRQAVGNIVNDEMVVTASKNFEAPSRVFNAMIDLVKNRAVSRLVLMGRFITYVRVKHGRTFQTIKAKLVHNK